MSLYDTPEGIAEQARAAIEVWHGPERLTIKPIPRPRMERGDVVTVIRNGEPKHALRR